jgi:hypothetical protein
MLRYGCIEGPRVSWHCVARGTDFDGVEMTALV